MKNRIEKLGLVVIIIGLFNKLNNLIIGITETKVELILSAVLMLFGILFYIMPEWFAGGQNE